MGDKGGEKKIIIKDEKEEEEEEEETKAWRHGSGTSSQGLYEMEM